MTALTRMNRKGKKDLTSKLMSSLVLQAKKFDQRTLGQVLSMESLVEEQGVEGINPDVLDTANTIQEQVIDTIQSEKPEILEQLTEEEKEVALESAVIAAAGILGTNPAESFVGTLFRTATNSLKGENAVPVAAVGNTISVEDAMQYSAEAFTEQNLKDGLGLTVSYNLQAPIQQEFGAKFYPPVIIDPTQITFTRRTRTLVSLDDGWQHPGAATTKGDKASIKRRNIVEGFRDYTLLSGKKLDLTPVFTGTGASNAWNQGSTNYKYFAVDQVLTPGSEVPGLVGNTGTVVGGGTTYYTRPLRPGVVVDLLGISKRDDLAPLYNQTDEIDGNVVLKYVYVALSTTVVSDVIFQYFRIPVSGLSGATFNKSPSQDYKRMDINATFNVGVGTADMAGAELLAAYAGAGARVKFELNAYGTTNLETGETVVNFQTSGVQAVDNTGADVAFTQATTLVVLGYDLDANRTNNNLRTTGHLLSTREYNDFYSVGVNAPISIQQGLFQQVTATSLSDVDSEAVQQAAHLMMSNNCVTELLAYADRLQEYMGNMVGNVANGIDGSARWWMKPYYAVDAIEIDNTASLTSSDRAQDIQSNIIEKIRLGLLKGIQESELIQGIQSVAGGVNVGWKVLIGTDQVLKNYIMRDGDPRTFGAGLESEVVASFDKRVDNKIFVTVVDASGDPQSPATFGNMLYTPTPVVRFQRTTAGGTFTEVMTIPRFRHIQNLPFLLVFNVTGLENAIERLPVYFYDV